MIKFICDGCKKEVNGTWFPAAKKLDKPENWFVRSDKDGEQHACSRECVETVAKETGKTAVVVPI